MTQPIDVAYVEIQANSRDFSKQVDKQITKELRKVEDVAEDVAASISSSFREAGENINGVFRDTNGRLRDARGRFTKLGEDAASAFAEVGETLGGALLDSLRKVGSLLSGATGLIGQLASAGPVGIAVLVTAFAALAAVIGVAAAALQNLLTIGLFVGAALPGAITAAIAGFGILAVALNGVAEAFQEQTKQSNAAGSAAVSNARQVADAQRGVLQAQKDLIKARVEERERIQDVNRELIAARTREKRLADDVLKAEFALAEAKRIGTPRAQIEAQLALEEANAALAEGKDRTEDLAAEKAKADRVGVEGSDRVLAAQEALRDAQDRLAQSQQKISAGAAAQTRAFDGLTKSAQAFVTALISAKEQLGPVADAIQEAFFAGTAPLIQPIVDNLKELQPELVRVSSAFGKIFQEILKFLGGDEAQAALDSILTGLADFLEAVTPAIRPLLNAFAGLVGQSGQFGDDLGGAIATGMQKLADFVNTVDLKALFDDAKTAVKELLPLIKPLLSITIDLFKMFVAFGRVALPPVTFALTVLAGAMTLAEQAFSSAMVVLREVEQFVREKMFKAFKSLGDFVRDLPENLRKAGPALLAAGKELIGKFFDGLGAAGGFLQGVGKDITNTIIRFFNDNVINRINSGIQKIQDGLNALPIIDGVVLPKLNRIPQLAQGGLITQDGIFRGGEGNKAEGVIPLEDSRAMRRIAEAIAAAGGAGAGAGQINFAPGSINVSFDGVVPTEQQAFNTGRAIASGIASRLGKQRIRLAVRTI